MKKLKKNLISIKVRRNKDHPSEIGLLFPYSDKTKKSVGIGFRTDVKDYDDYLNVLEDVGLALRFYVKGIRNRNTISGDKDGN